MYEKVQFYIECDYRNESATKTVLMHVYNKSALKEIKRRFER